MVGQRVAAHPKGGLERLQSPVVVHVGVMGRKPRRRVDLVDASRHVVTAGLARSGCLRRATTVKGGCDGAVDDRRGRHDVGVTPH